MCGIAGYIGKRKLSDAAVAACHALMGRRGPDAVGVYHHAAGPERHVDLLHSRLSIIDLDQRANQPMQRGPHVVATNGEIYNFVELRRELESRSVTFTTQSDTEVLLAAIAQWGMAGALDRCEGMWAIAAFDEKSGFLTLARDRFGEKPLYMLSADDGMYFGSEVKFIAALAGRPLRPNTAQLQRLIVNGYRALYKSSETFFDDVRELPAGAMLQLGSDFSAAPARYWNPDIARNDALGFDDAVEQAREAVIDAVRIRLRADVPLAFCMSGGIDSNSLISIAANMFEYDVHGFTVVNQDSRYIEQDMVNAAVDAQNLRHTEVPLETKDFLPRLRTLIRQHDAPVFTISAYCHWLLMEAVHDAGYKIAISGTGADELFSGYYDHHLAYLAAMHGTPDYDNARANWETHILPHVLNPLLRNPDMFVDNPEERRHL
ncbi:MAG: asparagine synthase (glutamine-hydrolyzing), partial [Alphaproteobacteria bacterium]